MLFGLPQIPHDNGRMDIFLEHTKEEREQEVEQRKKNRAILRNQLRSEQRMLRRGKKPRPNYTMSMIKSLVRDSARSTV